MNRFSILIIPCFLLMYSCGEEKLPNDTMVEFAETTNQGEPFNLLHDESSRIVEIGYTKTRKYAEKLDISTITCEMIGEEEAACSCKTESGKNRNFSLYLNDDKWFVSLDQPEFILEIFHIMYSQGMINDAIPFATKTEKDRLEVFKSMTNGMEIPEADRKVIPFEIKCKKFKKKYECSCISEEGESTYILFKTSRGWKAELGNISVFDNDSIIDYNSTQDFNLNQHDLDSLTDFSQKMLDSMLSL